MTVSFNIDIDALIEEIESDPARADKWIDKLLEVWSLDGILTLNSYESLPDKAMKLVDCALSHRISVSRLVSALTPTGDELNRRIDLGGEASDDVCFKEIGCCTDLEAIGPRASLLLMGNQQVSSIRTSTERVCIHCDEQAFEIVPWIDAESACMVRENQPSAIIPFGTSGREIWETYFHQYASYAREIVLVDKYAVEINNLSALSAFLEWANDSCLWSDTLMVRIFSTIEDITPQKIDEAESACKDKGVGRYDLGGVEITLFDRDSWLPTSDDISRDRWIRFGERVVYNMHGIDILHGRTTPGEACVLLDQTSVDDLVEVEQKYFGRRSPDIILE